MAKDRFATRALWKRKSSSLAFLLPLSCLLGFTPLASAQDFAMTDLQGNPASLDSFRNDGKLTLFMTRYHGCAPCDTSEQELHGWYAEQDQDKVSVLALNIDEADTQGQARQRLNSLNINYPNFFSVNKDQTMAAFLELTGKALPGVPFWVLLGPDGSYIGSEPGVDFDWETMDDMVLSLDSGLPGILPSVKPELAETPKPARTRPSAEDIRSTDLAVHINKALVREDMVRTKAWLDDALKENPDHPALLAAQVRFLMITERVQSNNPLGYQFSKSAEATMQEALNVALDANPENWQALYLQAELFAVQGNLQYAQGAIDAARPHLLSDSWTLEYIESLLLAMQNKPADAVAKLEPLLYRKAKGHKQYFMFQRIWDLVKVVSIKHPQVDPVSLMREGLMIRVASSELLDEITRRSKSETPLMLIVNSEDPHCSHCVNVAEKIEPFVRKNEAKYNFIYTSVEPWMNIAYQEWAHNLPRMLAVPKAAVFARSQYMISAGIPIGDEYVAWYEDKVYPQVLSENPGVMDYAARVPLAKVMVGASHWNAIKGDIAAFASVRTKDNQAWGAVTRGDGRTQAQVNEDALALCAKYAADKGIDKACALHTPAAKK